MREIVSVGSDGLVSWVEEEIIFVVVEEVGVDVIFLFVLFWASLIIKSFLFSLKVFHQS